MIGEIVLPTKDVILNTPEGQSLFPGSEYVEYPEATKRMRGYDVRHSQFVHGDFIWAERILDGKVVAATWIPGPNVVVEPEGLSREEIDRLREEYA